ncbi:SH3 domain-containing protein [Ditylenchus destructor]|nr:SH3 domain-containing protein [Ditylenchus destructor]
MADIYVVVKYDYTAQEDQELTIRKNDRLKLLDDSKNWWKVAHEDGQVGFVPSNYVRKESFVEKAFKGLGRSRSKNQLFDHNLNGSAQSSEFGDTSALASNGTRVNSLQTNAMAKYDYEPQRDDELALTKGCIVNVLDKSSDGWWKGEVNGSKGWFPSNYVDEIAESNDTFAQDYNTNGNSNGAAISAHEPAGGHSVKSNGNYSKVHEIVVSLYSFEAQNTEELTFKKGEKLDIVDHPTHDPEWWMAKNQLGQIGLVPTNYIEIVDHNPLESAFAKLSTGTAFSQNGGDIQVPSSSVFPAANVLTGPYATQPWYYGRLTREQADAELRARGVEGDFLVRDSESNPGDFSISLKDNVRNKHFWIQVDKVNGTFKIGNRTFKSMEALIQHYKSSPIFSNEETKENLYLVKPLPRY